MLYDITGNRIVGKTYTFIKISVLSGYQLAKPVKITVKDTSKVQTVTGKDKSISDVPNTTQIGGTLLVIPLDTSFHGVAAADLWRVGKED